MIKKIKRKIAEYRENTVKYNDKQWEDKYQFIQQNKRPVEAYDYHWDGFMFEVLGYEVLFKGKFLDVGCSLGHFCRYIKAKSIYMDVWGVDMSPVAIKRGRELAKAAGAKINLVVGDANKLPFDDETFDYVSNIDIIEHVKDPEHFLKEIKRVLKPGGIIITSTPWRGLILKDKLEGHRQEWTPEEMAKLMDKHFKDVRLSIPPIMINRIKNKEVVLHWFGTLGTK